MKKVFLFLLLTGGGVLTAFSAMEAREVRLKETHRRASDPETVLKLRDKMTRMEAQYLDLQILANASDPDFNRIKDALNDLQSSVEGIQKANPGKELEKPLQDLAGQVGHLHKHIKPQDPIGLRKGVDGLYESCFRCHATHAPLM